MVRELPAVDAYEFDPARFEGMTVPTVLVVGSECPPQLGDSTDPLVAALPNNRTVVLDGQAHAAMNTAPARFTDTVLAFIRDSS